MIDLESKTYKNIVKEVAEEWSDVYRQEPVERDYLSDVQKRQITQVISKRN